MTNTGANRMGSKGRTNKANTFADLYCLCNKCPRAEYQERAFGELLYGHAKWIAVAIRRCNRRAFTQDIQLIRDIGETTDLMEALALVASFQKANRARRNIRTLFKFRLSGFKARLLAYSVFLERARVAERPLAFRHMHTTLGA